MTKISLASDPGPLHSSHEDLMSASRKQAWMIAAAAPVVAAPLVFAAAQLSGMPHAGWATLSGVILMLTLATATVTDLRWHRITNWTTYPAFVWAFGLNLVVSLVPGWQARLGGVGIQNCLLGAGFAFALFLVIFNITGGGAGDVKLMTCIGALLGPYAVFDVAVYSFLVGGFVLFFYASWQYGPGMILGGMVRLFGSTLFPYWISPLTDEERQLLKSPVPLGPFFATGTLLYTMQDATWLAKILSI